VTYEKQSSDHQQNYRIIPISLEVVVSQYLVVDLGVQNQQQEERDDTKKYKPCPVLVVERVSPRHSEFCNTDE